MVYAKKTWISKEVINTSELNNIEQGIEDAHVVIAALQESDTQINTKIDTLHSTYDTNNDGIVNEADFAWKLKDGGTGKTYADISAEIDSNISVHTLSATAHHSNVNDPTADQKAALNGATTPNAANPFATRTDLDGLGYGDMLTSVYDKDHDGKVDVASLADSVPWTGITGVPLISEDGHTHQASNITDFENAVSSNVNVSTNTAARHTHSNKELLDSIASLGSGNIITSDERNKLNGIETQANKYVLPAATTTSLGGIKVGTGLEVSSGVLTPAKATTTSIGAIKVGPGLLVDVEGVLSANTEGVGDMLKSVYDKDIDGKIDVAALADAVEWTGVLNKPATFPPNTHTHSYSSLTDRPNVLVNEQLITTIVNDDTKIPSAGAIVDYVAGLGYGDMLKTVYDTNGDGKVDAAVNADIVDWTGVANKPVTYPPSSHSHPLSDVPHTHGFADITSRSYTYLSDKPPADAFLTAEVTNLKAGNLADGDVPLISTQLVTAIVDDDTKIPSSGAIVDYCSALGNGDMLKAAYDSDSDGKVNAAVVADKLAVSKTISLSGDVTGSVAFDGGSNVNIVASVTDSSHTHTIATVTDLQTTLDNKANTGHSHLAAVITDLAETVTGLLPTASTTAKGMVQIGNGLSITPEGLLTTEATGEVYTTEEKTKLTGIETGATADQTGDEIVSAVNTGATTKIDVSKLNIPVATLETPGLMSSIDKSKVSTWNIMLDGGSADDVYTSSQVLDGGTTDWTTFPIVEGDSAFINHIVRSSTVTHAIVDADSYKDFEIQDFTKHGIIKKITLRANYTAGQQADFTALVNNAAGILPSDTSLAYDGSVGTIAVGDYLQIDGEIVKVTAGTSTPLTIERGKKGTRATFHNDNSQIVKLNDGIRLALYTGSDRKAVEEFFELSRIMSWQGTTDAAISAGDALIGFTADPVSVDADDRIVILDATNGNEDAIVQQVNHDTVNAAYDFTIVSKDALSDHVTGLNIQKIAVFDLAVPYYGADTLYGRVFVDETITSDVIVNISVEAARYA